MVKLEGLTQKEVEKIENERKYSEKILKRENECREFAKITSDIVGFRCYRINSDYCFGLEVTPRFFDFNQKENPIYIHLFVNKLSGSNDIRENKITVLNPKYLDEALKLARAYEEAGFGEVTVKKQYEE